jgi:hypothetical protein
MDRQTRIGRGGSAASARPKGRVPLVGWWTFYLGVAVCAPQVHAQAYVSPYVGGITPDKPWRASGSAALLGLDIGMELSADWSAELDLNGAPLTDRSGTGHTGLYGGALALVRVFNRTARFATYLSVGLGLTHDDGSSQTGLAGHTEFMIQPGIGAFIGIWESEQSARRLALRPDIKVRWTHGWAHAPGNPVDPLYGLGLTFTF